jgi:uncharacterized protein (DUF3084 family)
VAVLTVMSFFSENVRTALFTLRSLRQDLEKHTRQLAESRAELEEAHFELETLRNDRNLLVSEKNDLEASVYSLREESEELRRELDRMRLGTIMVQANALLAQGFIPPESSQTQVRKILSDLEEEARAAIADRRSETRYTSAGDVRLSVDLEEESDVALRLSNSSDRLYVRILAAENIATGDNVRVRLESGVSYLLYNEGEMLYRKLVDPRDNSRGESFNAEEALHVFLRELRNQTIRNGVLPDPVTNSVGSLEGEEFFEAVDQLKGITTPSIINAVAFEDIYTEGPIRIKIVLE